MSEGAKKFNYVRPAITENKQLNVEGGRHPLQELCVETFVANDTLFNEAGPWIHLIKGANYSGKSVYLKQVSYYNCRLFIYIYIIRSL